MIGEIISAGANLVGGFLNRKAQSEANEKNAQLQKDFAQQGISWKVEDAKRAGIHPLYALGAQTMAASPSYVGETGVGTGLAAAGQDLSRAMNATRTSGQRDAAFNKTVQDLTLQKFGLENELLASKIAQLKASNNPPMPSLAGPVPEEDKYKARPKLIMGGSEIATDPKTSNMDEYSKRYGDEGLPQWLIPPLIMWEDMKANVGQPSGGRSGFRDGSLLDRWWNRGRR